MVFRFLMRYFFANNEQLVQKLSESYPIRRAAQLVVGAFFKSKSIVDKSKLGDPQRFIKRFQDNIKEEFKNAKDELKKK